MQNFHNIYVKKTLILNYSPSKLTKSNSQVGKLLDLACGKGGDLSKWKNAKIKDVIAIDISKPCVEYGKNFFKTYPKPKPTVRYIWGDTSKLIWPEQECGKSTMDKERMKEWIPNKNDFDVVSCQFCIHYYFENELKLRTLLQNVSDNIKIGGYFIGTCFNGKNVFNLLKGIKVSDGSIDDKTIWKIEKDYKIRTFKDEKPNLGQKIKVYIDSIGETHIEYLVNLSYLESMMTKYGFELVEYKSFESYYLDFEKDNNKNKTKNKKVENMSDAEKKMSYLNTSFCFKKTSITPDKEYKNLITLIKKNK
jgi:mRNA (guanine-N7-)-methyltransferase